MSDFKDHFFTKIFSYQCFLGKNYVYYIKSIHCLQCLHYMGKGKVMVMKTHMSSCNSPYFSQP